MKLEAQAPYIYGIQQSRPHMPMHGNRQPNHLFGQTLRHQHSTDSRVHCDLVLSPCERLTTCKRGL